MEEVESELDKLRKLNEPSLINVLANAMVRSETGWRLSIVMELNDGNRMSDLLQLCGSLPWSKVKVRIVGRAAPNFLRF